ncbi:MAG: hypothetical protein AAGB19_21440, partial [Cyanobacteria bacterium P01_F01_bin.3]
LQCHRRSPSTVQVIWRSKQSMFSGLKRRYIGMKGKAKHLQAVAERDRRNRRNQIIKRLEKLYEKKTKLQR